MKKCPRCGLPPEGELECRYCGLVFSEDIKNQNFQKKLKKLNWFQWRQQILKWFIILIIVFTVFAYLGLPFWLMVPVIIVILYFSSQAKNGNDVTNQLKSSGNKPIDKELDWLKERWERVEREKELGDLKTVDQWYFDEATERQLARIKKNGTYIGSTKLTKGKASDLIGLSEKPEEGSEEILKFFRVPTKGISETRAREEIAKIFSDPEKVKAWKARPATQMQKEFFRFFNQEIPRDITYETASRYINDYHMEHEEEEDKLDEWDNYECIYDDIDDPDFRKDWRIKKVSLPIYRQAIEMLKSEGMSLSEPSTDHDRVIEKIVEIKPDIQKK